MTIYDKEVFNYLTQPANYRAAKEIAEQMGRIDQELKQEFWEKVADKILQSISPTGWTVELSYSDEWLSVHRVEWQNLGINCDQLSGVPDLGIHAPNDVFNRATVNTLLEPLISAEGKSRKPTDGWPYYNKLGPDFYQSSSLESILPDNREDIITRVSERILSFFNLYSPLLDKIATEAQIVS
jgi:hypothetical protein